MESGKTKKGVMKSSFQMPLHYPRYTKKDYESMPEWELDRLLAEYGLAVQGHDLEYKREFAMGAFLWPDFGHEIRTNSNGLHYHHQDSASHAHKKSKIFEFIKHILGYARQSVSDFQLSLYN
ncbi:hypothetical protein HS088_TW09G00744 [Tripterygium wilfordii]|uniref:DUF7722 domain-containing protein n=1 Tax=Tripterygium wilfordii TaxID=458696 RepID=A0A7J7D8N2_TRIWF|nr:uncharacterized protein LOC120004810 [Tripterygium wilfordii]KAF5742692.1 hypothetical protein HS088_TW09G00744 [Tripterygium wilfordii]